MPRLSDCDRSTPRSRFATGPYFDDRCDCPAYLAAQNAVI